MPRRQTSKPSSAHRLIACDDCRSHAYYSRFKNSSLVAVTSPPNPADRPRPGLITTLRIDEPPYKSTDTTPRKPPRGSGSFRGEARAVGRREPIRSLRIFSSLIIITARLNWEPARAVYRET
ncbi:unnamed protein product, partial [Iphiclides podalirius]